MNATGFDKAQNDSEMALFTAFETLLNAKRRQRDWNPSTTADELCDLVIGAGWTRPLSHDSETT